jgi:hypothetical protein
MDTGNDLVELVFVMTKRCEFFREFLYGLGLIVLVRPDIPKSIEPCAFLRARFL